MFGLSIAEPERVQRFRQESNTFTESPAVLEHVGDPLQIYALRFSGHYGLPERNRTKSELHFARVCPNGLASRVAVMGRGELVSPCAETRYCRRLRKVTGSCRGTGE